MKTLGEEWAQLEDQELQGAKGFEMGAWLEEPCPWAIEDTKFRRIQTFLGFIPPHVTVDKHFH